MISAFLIIQFYSYPFASLEYDGTRILNAFIILGCKSILPVFFAWICYNYYGFNLNEIFKEIGFNLIYFKLFSKNGNLNRKRNDKKRLNGFKINSELEMVSNLNGQSKEEEIDSLIKDNNLINDKFIIQLQDNFLKIKLNELILNEQFKQLNEFEKEAKINQKQEDANLSSFKSLATIYTQLTKSIFYSHHFYLIFDLYTIRTPLSTNFYDILARLIYNLFYIHLIAILYYLFIELPVHSSTKLIYLKILKLFDL